MLQVEPGTNLETGCGAYPQFDTTATVPKKTRECATMLCSHLEQMGSRRTNAKVSCSHRAHISKSA